MEALGWGEGGSGEGGGSQVRFEVALGDWIATGVVWVERLAVVWGNVSASRKETPPPTPPLGSL